ncbi:MAG: sigma-70 family RNA polymerase sigma factor [Oscillospiraceae bacterium]|nr:sigma-70 family RNA polymerase sigma factor [Oscillospiraceae bacterium]
MEGLEILRKELVSYIRRKFRTRRNIMDMADEIVNQAFLSVMKASGFREEQYNFGYMSTACIREAYKQFHRNDRDAEGTVSFELTAPLIDEDSFVEEIEKAEDTRDILQSLQTLKQVEQIIIRERYFEDFSFREISEHHGINLNTVLSHHRRALEKLRPALAKYFPYRARKYHYGGHYND